MPKASTFTDQRAGVIVRAIEAGLADKAACGVADVPLRTFRRWVAKGKALDEECMEPLAVFARQVDAARAWAALTVINDASKMDGWLALTMLERLYPEEYGPRRGLEELTRQVDTLAEQVARNTAGRG